MAFRVVLIENEVTMKVKLNNLIIDKGEGDVWIPIDDISMIVLDNLRISLTTRMLSTLAEHNVGIVICDQNHLPLGFYSSYDNHSRMAKCIGFQIEKNEDFYDELWKEIVQIKIQNQQQVLERLHKDKEVIQHMEEFQKNVQKGDVSNREAHAAKIYFNELMGATFSRGNEDILLNSGLNYGYTIVRAYMARLCVGYGLNSQIGIHHKNEYNRFNLIDDLIEPIRPIVDYYVYQILEKESYFKPEHRRKLVNLLNHKVLYRGKKMYVCNMLEEYISQYAALLAHKREKIDYPNVKDYLGGEDEV